MPIIIIGNRAPIRKKLSCRFDPVKGITVTQEFESAGDQLGGLALAAQTAGMDYTLDINPCRSRLVMTTTGAAAGFKEKATSTWQLFTNDYQRDIRESNAALAIGPAVMKKIESAIEMMREAAAEGIDANPLLDGIEQTYAEFTADDGPFPPGSDVKLMLDLMLHGTSSIEVTYYSARVSISLPFLYSGEIPGVAPDSLMADLINNIAVGGPNDGNLYKWGWRRLGSSRTFQGNNRTEISIEWRLGSWPPLLYPVITALPV